MAERKKREPGLQFDDVGAYMQFVGPDGKRRKLRLTDFSKREAERYVEKINILNRHVKYAMPFDSELLAWVSKIRATGGLVVDRLVEYGLLTKIEADAVPAVPTLGPTLDAYVKVRTDVKPGTATFYNHTKRNLLDYFGADKPLADVTPGDADEFRLWLLRPHGPEGTDGQELSENTARRRCSLASQFFRSAVRKGIITSNPFEGVGGVVKSNKARMFFVTRDDADKVLAACPDLEWRLIFALARFGGLRTPSEHYGLRWSDVDWARGKFLVRSPKTAHHEGGESRWVPIFDELYPLLRDAFEAPGSAEFVLTKYRNQANLRTRFEKIIKRAGLTPWPKLFQNLRSTRQTELAASYPLHLVCSWLGNKAAIAAEHYLQVTDADFAQVARRAVSGIVESLGGGAIVGTSRTTDDDPISSSTQVDHRKEPHRAAPVIAGSIGNVNQWAIQDSNL